MLVYILRKVEPGRSLRDVPTASQHGVIERTRRRS
jgi:hypothetical protein